ncbi:DUF3579 domain-containing protein [Burkholderia cepacia]|uniref:DUF3579 domain-containing protein n=1 Tax=Burkholderia cepacia TaxID=292 RepID=UPI000F5E32AA|nr:DUF3579 domain-containing protein [Burkholderia cepacia]RRA08426.1 DUF3579 domain-containing protein [Burkholderia cepacia]RRA09640.1 DUF3579 domain-containing protein [Burkholderia cepacia]
MDDVRSTVRLSPDQAPRHDAPHFTTVALLTATALRTVCADAFDFAMQFATDNDLPVELQTVPALAVR